MTDNLWDIIGVDAKEHVRISISQKNKNFYHTIDHVESVWQSIKEITLGLLTKKERTILAYVCAYHDIIYDPLSKTNEADSAQFFRKNYREVICTDEICKIIELSANHLETQKNIGRLAETFLDADLYMLGSFYDVFMHGRQRVINEGLSALMSNDTLKLQGSETLRKICVRKNTEFLSKLLERERIYYSPNLAEREERLRANIKKIIEEGE